MKVFCDVRDCSTLNFISVSEKIAAPIFIVHIGNIWLLWKVGSVEPDYTVSHLKEKQYSHFQQLFIGPNYSARIEEYQIGVTCSTDGRDKKRI
jgi:hypothetical protein